MDLVLFFVVPDDEDIEDDEYENDEPLEEDTYPHNDEDSRYVSSSYVDDLRHFERMVGTI